MPEVLLLAKTSLLNQLGLSRLRQPGAAPPWLKLSAAVFVVALGLAAVIAWLSTYWLIFASALAQVGMLDLLLLQALLLTSFISFFKNLYLMPGQLYFFRDYDLLMSLPLRTSTVLMSKLATLLAADWLLTAILMLPPLIIYGSRTHAGTVFYLFVVITLPFVPLVPLTVSALFALLTGRLAARFPQGNKIITTLAIPVAIWVTAAYLKFAGSARGVVASAKDALDQAKHWYPPAGLFFHALEDQQVVPLLLFIGLSLALFVCFCLFFARFFRSIHDRLAATFAKANYKLRELNAASVLRALFRKEFRGYFSCPIYILNTSFGMVMLTAFAIAMACMGNQFVARTLAPLGLANKTPLFCLLVAVGSAAISCTTAASISLEGPSLWILKTAPVLPQTIFRGKLLLNLSLTLPLIALNSVILAFAFRFDLRHWLLLWAVPSVYAMFVATSGLLINLLYPKFEFKHPAVVVKQSASALLSFLVHFIAGALPVALYIYAAKAWLSYELYATIVAAVLLALTAALWQVLRTKGVHWFARLH